ncbi:class I SAM-dependent methyltransferase [Longispora sp. K20-0274]|uniref:class I SAM-dependent methyltransferase n=1 Tax=Longispora sp. K20-0274 TaxID=3088255 RepID=UPI00399997A4
MTIIAGDSGLQTSVLEDLGDARRYRRWLAELTLPHLGEHPLEIGSGLGDYAEEWIPHLTAMTASEAEPDRFAQLKARYHEHPTITVRQLGLPSEPDPEPRYSSVVSLNVLEHIADDVGALRSMRGFVRPGGTVVAVVPAFPSAMSRFDHAIGHQRRYTKRTAAAAFEAAGLTVETVRYVNPIGLLTWYVSAKALRMIPRNGLGLRLYDAAVVPVARVVDKVWAPFGQSVFVVARV